MIPFFLSSPIQKEMSLAGKEQLPLIRAKFEEADAVLIGAGSGLSSAAGYNHYHTCDAFQRHFSDYIEEYGFQGMFQGYYHLFSSPEEQWAYYSRYIGFMLDAPAGQPYRDLYSLLQGKDYFVLTTNGDIQVSKVFPKDRIFQFQGDFHYLQCSQPCHDRIYDSEPVVRKMLREASAFRVPYDTIPRCPECGRMMVPWVRDKEFLEGDYWLSQQRQYMNFLKQNQNKKVVLLELGVGDMTPSVIKFPFWKLAEEWENAFYVSVNLAKSSAPSHLGSKAAAVADDLGHFLKEFLTEAAKNGKI